MSRLIVVEGPDRVGKATQSKLLCDYLNSIGKKASVVEVPVRGNFTYNAIYWMLKHGLAKSFPTIFQCLQCANRLIFQTHQLINLEHENDFVIFDRWSLSTITYGSATGVSSHLTSYLYKLLRKPDYTLILLGDSHEHQAEDVYEEDIRLQQRVREVYAEWSLSHPKDSHVVDSNRSIDSVHDEIIRVLKIARVIPV